MPKQDDWSFAANIDRGYLPTGESLEALYGAGWWTEEPPQEQLPPIVPCHKCGGQSYDLGDEIDCENCGIISIEQDAQDETD